MTKDEIKESYSMRYICEQYGLIPNRSGFIPCPFHREKTASMKIYEDSFHCFGCGDTGDIFDFTMKMDNLSFKEAFLSLGGSYENDKFSAKMAVYHSTKRQKMQRKKKHRIEQAKRLNNDLISVYRKWYRKSKPFSQTWTDCYNALQYQLYIHEKLNEPR